ncbi:hypothetical protein [Flammeovirga sp. SJP92]|uniref:hypothetical protein n=1 Tax=Flammeovirga sp. SJP92 TaxID=1775430 RepID=UPI000787987C|nr:hypothetical protein [Flammeovirga sp. SJP92]KXX68840.1 hypothetical protein AVL50_18575 [Flammeovirga sp. SJP92]
MKTSKEKILSFLQSKIKESKESTQTNFNNVVRLMHQPYLNEGIGKGSIFETESSLFVVGVKLPALKYEGKNIIGLTTDSPFYRFFKNKKDGDEVKFGNDIEHIKII